MQLNHCSEAESRVTDPVQQTQYPQRTSKSSFPPDWASIGLPKARWAHADPVLNPCASNSLGSGVGLTEVSTLQWHHDHLGAGPLPARIWPLLGHQSHSDPPGKGWDITTTMHTHAPFFLLQKQGWVSGYGLICVWLLAHTSLKSRCGVGLGAAGSAQDRKSVV